MLDPPSTPCSHSNPHDSNFLVGNLPSDFDSSSDSSDSFDSDLRTLRIGAINIKGVKFNTPFLHDFLDTLDICCISEHWLHSFLIRRGYPPGMEVRVKVVKKTKIKAIQSTVLLDIEGVMVV